MSYEYDESGNEIKSAERYEYPDESWFVTIIETEYDEAGIVIRDIQSKESSDGSWDKLECYYKDSVRIGYRYENFEGKAVEEKDDIKGNQVWYRLYYPEGGSYSEIMLRRANGNPVRLVKFNSGNYREYFDYDENGNILDSEAEHSSASEYINEFYYESTAREADKYQGSKYDDDGKILLRIAYDINGNGFVEEYEYDEDGRLAKKMHSDIDAFKSYSIEYTYDADGNVIENCVY